MADLFDVIAVNIKTRAERFLDVGKSEDDADAIVRMAVIRRGVEDEFFTMKRHPYVLQKTVQDT